MPERGGGGERVQQQKTFNALRMILQELKGIPGKSQSFDPKFVLEWRRRVGGMLFQENAIPSTVRELDLGDGLKVSRNIPQQTQGETWNLSKVDQHASQLAQTLGQEWQPLFSSPPSQK